MTDWMIQLERLNSLKAKGVISQEEFEIAHRKIMTLKKQEQQSEEKKRLPLPILMGGAGVLLFLGVGFVASVILLNSIKSVPSQQTAPIIEVVSEEIRPTHRVEANSPEPPGLWLSSHPMTYEDAKQKSFEDFTNLCWIDDGTEIKHVFQNGAWAKLEVVSKETCLTPASTDLARKHHLKNRKGSFRCCKQGEEGFAYVGSKQEYLQPL